MKDRIPGLPSSLTPPEGFLKWAVKQTYMTAPTTAVNPTTLPEAQNTSENVHTWTPRQSVHSVRQIPVAPGTTRHTPRGGQNYNSQTVCHTPSGPPTKVNRSRPRNLTDSSDSYTDSGASTSDSSDCSD